MYKFALKINTGEAIAYTNADDLTEAQINFAKAKDLTLTQLLMIFMVEMVK